MVFSMPKFNKGIQVLVPQHPISSVLLGNYKGIQSSLGLEDLILTPMFFVKAAEVRVKGWQMGDYSVRTTTTLQQ